MSGTSPSEPPSGPPPEGPRPKKQPKLVPPTLADFLLADKASAREFVRFLAKRPPLADDDLLRSHEILSTDPPKIKRYLSWHGLLRLQYPNLVYFSAGANRLYGPGTKDFGIGGSIRTKVLPRHSISCLPGPIQTFERKNTVQNVNWQR